MWYWVYHEALMIAPEGRPMTIAHNMSKLFIYSERWPLHGCSIVTTRSQKVKQFQEKEEQVSKEAESEHVLTPLANIGLEDIAFLPEEDLLEEIEENIYNA